MGAPTVPPVIPQPFANNNAALRNTIPNTTATPGAASWDQGFPSDTMQPVVAGGVPPFGQDMNGVEFTLSSHDYYVQAGELFPFQSAVATAIGGYGVGALLGSTTDANVVWVNTVANNSTNPDATDGSAVGWVSMFAYGFATPAAMTGAAPVALTNLQASRKFIVFTGALTNNQVVSLPANILKDWLIINNTSGSSFTLTLNTVAGGSAGVAVPQGGWSNPLGVYSDGTNVYPTVAPLGVPISQGPDPLTLSERNNGGDLLARGFQMTYPVDNFPTTNVMYDNGDGFIRRKTLANLEASMLLAGIGGQVSAGQVPSSAVLQYVASILASAALTGVPTAPTAPVGTSNAQVATTAFAAGSFSGNSVTLPNGFIIKFGVQAFSGTNVIANFPVAFPSQCFGMLVQPLNTSNQVYPTATPSTTTYGLAGGSGGINVFWIAVGN